MFTICRFYRKVICISGIISVLQQVGVPQKNARSLADKNSEYASIVSDILKHYDSKTRNIIATYFLLEIISEKAFSKKNNKHLEITCF